MKDIFIKCGAQTPKLPRAWEREQEIQFLHRFGAGLALCLLALFLFACPLPRAQTADTQESTAVSADILFTAPDFGDAAAARALQTSEWRYDTAWAKQYPGLATYRNGDNFITCGTLYTARSGHDALEILIEESGLAFTQTGDSADVDANRANSADSGNNENDDGTADALQCYIAQMDDASVQLYALMQAAPGAPQLVWAEVYIAAAPVVEMKQSARSAELFVRKAFGVAAAV